MLVVRRLLVALVACVLLTACRVDATVDVDVADDGSGTVAVTVTFDADAAARVPDLDGALRTEDLEDAGWSVTGPREEADGSVVVSASKPFASPDQLPTVLAEISPAFRDVRLSRHRTFGEVEWTFDSRVDFGGGAEQFGDAQLATLLGGRPLGRDVATIEQETGTSVADATGLVLDLSLPGDSSRQWTFQLDQAAPTDVHLVGTVERSAAKLWGIVAAVAAGLLVLVLAVALLRRGHRRRAAKAADDGAVMDVEVPADTTAPESRRLQLVVTAAHGVLWESHDVADAWLLSLAAMQGVEPGAERVRALRREAELGRLSTAEFWQALGVPGDAAELDAAYVARFTLGSEVVDFVRLLARRGIGVACVDNDTIEWSTLLRSRFDLDRFIRPWVVSADVGATLPAVAPLEEVCARAGVVPANCLYLDDRIAHLDVAKSLGMTTVFVGPAGSVARASGHQHATDLRGLLTRRRVAEDVG
jgi:FMN phosphatase YigB (HAD superfamily)